MKKHSFPLFTGIHTVIATILALSSSSQGQNIYWDTNGTASGFGDFTGTANGTNTLFNTDATGGAGGTFSAMPSAGNNLIIGGGGATGLITLRNGNFTVASIDFANTANLAALQIGVAGSTPQGTLTVTGDITDSGAGTSDVRVVNLSAANAATVLVANSITTGDLSFSEEGFTNAQYFTTGYNITLAGEFTIGRGNGNFTYTQTGGTVRVNDVNRGINFNGSQQGQASTSTTKLHTYNMNGGELRAGEIGVNVRNEGNNAGTQDRWTSNARLEFNSGTIGNNGANGTLLFQNGLSFNTFTGTGTRDMQYNTSLPLTVALSQTGTHTLNADGASSTIIVTPSAQFVNKTSENGTLTKTGLGNLVFTGGNPSAVNSYTGSTTVNAGLVSTDYNRIAGVAATGGTDNLSNGYSATSQLVLDGGNYAMVGRGSATASSASVTLNAGSAGLLVTVPSTAGLAIGQSVTNANLPAGTYIRRIISGTQIELNALSTSTSNLTGQTLNFGAATFNNTQTVNTVSILQNATVTVTPGAGSSSTLLSFGDVSGTGGLTKSGAGILKLTGAVTHDGTIAISAGTLEFASASNATLTKSISGGGTLVKSGAGTLTISHPSTGGNNFNGAIIVNEGTLKGSGAAKAFYLASSYTVNNGGVLESLGADAFGYGNSMANLTINTGGTFQGAVQQINALTLNGGLIDGTGLGNSGVNYSLRQDVTVGGTSASTIQGTQGIALNGQDAAAGGTRTFTIADATGNANADLIISTALKNGYLTNNLTNLQKSGAGTMLLSGNSTYTGTTTVSAGTLVINGNQNAATGAVSVAAGATNATAVRLKGVGTVGGNTSFAADPDGAGAQVGGIHSPGNSVGKQTFDASGAATTNLTYNSGSIFEWELAATPAATTITDNVNYTSNRGTAYDAVNVTGTLGGSDAIFRVVLDGNQTFADSFWSTNRTWSDIFRTGDGTGTGNVSYASIFSAFQYYNNSGAGATLNALATPTTYGSFSITGSSLNWSAVPEPTSALAGLLVTAGLLRRRRSA